MIDESGGLAFQDAPLVGGAIAKINPRMGVRTSVMATLNLPGAELIPKGPAARLSELGTVIRLVLNRVCRWSTRKRTPMKIDDLADAWVEAIEGMCTSHDKDGYDANDAKADKLLTPLLAAPVKQVREFYGVLLQKLQANPKIPFLVWISYEAWGAAFVKDAPDEKIKRLKRKLAADIAELVEGSVADQIPGAIKRALCWRDEEQLKEVKEALETGAKPKLVGRQSCLFLEVKPRGKREPVSVMI